MKKKLLIVSLMALAVTGCSFWSTPTVSDYRKLKTEPNIPLKKIELNCLSCDEDDLEDYFTKGDKDSRYYLTMSTSSYYGDDMLLLDNWKSWVWLPYNVVSIATLCTLPTYFNERSGTVHATLHDKETGLQANLAPVEIEAGEWVSFLSTPLLYPFMYADYYNLFTDNMVYERYEWEEKAQKKTSKYFLKQAAIELYNTTSTEERLNWTCPDYKCKYKFMMDKVNTTAEDVLWIADNTKSFDDFQKVKNKLDKPLTTEQNCTAIQRLLSREVVSKDTRRYWSFVDFYKNNCKADGMFGMTKEQLIAKKGIPSKGYAINADTEIMSYSSLSANGESVNTTTYTLDRGIVTSVK